MVSPAHRIFHCFACSAGGDVYGWLMRRRGMTFPEAVEWVRIRPVIAEASRVIIAQTQELERALRELGKLDPKTRPMSLAAQGTPEQQSNLLGGYAFTLWCAEPFYIAPDPCDLIRLGAASIPPWNLRRIDLPSLPGGFLFFSSPIRLSAPLAGHPSSEVRAIAYSLWKKQAGAGVVGIGRIEEATGVYVFWLLTDGLVIDDSWTFDEPRQPERPIPLGDGKFENEELDRLFASALAFMQQRVLVRERVRDNRAARKLAEANGLTDTPCTIVILRRGKPSKSDAAGRDTQWSSRWWVAGHWRQQPCGEGRINRRPTWIAPYVKGPEDKPISAKKRLFVVAR